ncbi:MAG: gamma-glutamyl-phosphate reductase, partial [Chloroflexi bacterium]|nr:gamma-glutamyl-phosphate reductase [Chloroflexota bacterium]
MTTATTDLKSLARAARKAARLLACASSEGKNAALLDIAKKLESEQKSLLDANARDLEAAASSIDEHLIDRLLLNRDRLNAIARDVRNIAALPDPVGE